MTQLARTFSALGDPTRLQLVEHLVERGEEPASALVARAGLSAPAVSRHLKVLREAGVLRQRADGTRRLYSVEPAAMQAISGWITDRRAFWSASLDRLDSHLASDPGGDTP